MNREARNKEQIKNEITTRVNNIREMFNVKRPLN